MVQEVSSSDQTSFDAMMDSEHPTKIVARDWADEHLPSATDMRDQVVDRHTWRAAGDFGVLGFQIPASHGGSDAAAANIALAFEGMGASGADNGVVFALASQSVTANRALAVSGSGEQLDRWAQPLASGELFASFAMSEVGAGSNPWEISTTADLQTDGSFILNGTKSWVTLGPVCDVAVVFATTDPSRGSWGISAFIIDASTPGFERGPAIEKMGLNGCPFGELHFTDCHVGPDALLANRIRSLNLQSYRRGRTRIFVRINDRLSGTVHRRIDRPCPSPTPGRRPHWQPPGRCAPHRRHEAAP